MTGAGSVSVACGIAGRGMVAMDGREEATEVGSCGCALTAEACAWPLIGGSFVFLLFSLGMTNVLLCRCFVL